MGGTQEVAGGLTKLGSAPARPAPRGRRHPSSWQVMMPIAAPLAGSEEAGSRLAADVIPCLAGSFWSRGRPWGEHGDTLPGDSCVPQFPHPAGTVFPRGLCRMSSFQAGWGGCLHGDVVTGRRCWEERETGRRGSINLDCGGQCLPALLARLRRFWSWL